MADSSLSILVDFVDDDLWIQRDKKASAKHAVKEKLGPAGPKVWTVRAGDNEDEANEVREAHY
jgi:hypothetical protein